MQFVRFLCTYTSSFWSPALRDTKQLNGSSPLYSNNNNIIVRYCTPCQPKIDRSIDHNILWQYIQQQQYVKLEEEITSSSIERNRKQCQITPGLVISRWKITSWSSCCCCCFGGTRALWMVWLLGSCYPCLLVQIMSNNNNNNWMP